MTTPRGIRNRNPLNIRKSSNNWKHKITPSTDRDFEQFETMEWGVRAAFVIVRTYIKSFNRLLQTPTVERIVSRWAPACENDTRAYIKFVEYKSKGLLSSTTIMKFEDKELMVWLLWCMAAYECGQELPMSMFSAAYEMV